MIGSKPDDHKELRILNRTLRWCEDGLVFAANLRHAWQGDCRRVGIEQVEASLVSGFGSVARCQDDDTMKKRNACISELKQSSTNLRKISWMQLLVLLVLLHRQALKTWNLRIELDDTWEEHQMFGRVSLFMITHLQTSCATRILIGLRMRYLGGRRLTEVWKIGVCCRFMSPR